jgi:hypothetical protein
MLRALPDSAREAVMRQVQTIRLLQAYPVVLMSPYVVTYK